MIELDQIKSIYFIGIKGVAVSGLAVICKERGMDVAGSDVAEKFITDDLLNNAQVKVHDGFDARHLDYQPDLVVVGASWDESNAEVATAYARGMRWITESALRGMLSSEKKTIVVAGVHGKTTTTALLAFLFEHAEKDPSFLIGTGSVPQLNSNARWKNGQYFIVEGDEYIKSKNDPTPKFLDLHPAISIITGIEWEHVDVYKDVETLEKHFKNLVDKTDQVVIACGDSPSVKRIINGSDKKIITYGIGEDNEWQASKIMITSEDMSFSVSKGKQELGECQLKLFGEHNALNALAAIIVGLHEGMTFGKVTEILAKFEGSQRRFEVYQNKDLIMVDDYAHHPTAIALTLSAIAKRYADRKIWCVFQPHMASRTLALAEAFAQSFNKADKLFILDVFTSAREKNLTVDMPEFITKIRKYKSDVEYLGSVDDAVKHLKKRIEPGIVLVTMGAGDVYKVRDKLIG